MVTRDRCVLKHVSLYFLIYTVLSREDIYNFLTFVLCRKVCLVNIHLLGACLGIYWNWLNYNCMLMWTIIGRSDELEVIIRNSINKLKQLRYQLSLENWSHVTSFEKKEKKERKPFSFHDEPILLYRIYLDINHIFDARTHSYKGILQRVYLMSWKLISATTCVVYLVFLSNSLN